MKLYFKASSVLVFPFAAIMLGCGSSQEFKTVQGLQEKTRVLEQEVANLQKTKDDLIKDNVKSKVELSKDSEDRLVKIKLIYDEQIKNLESQNATLMLELGKVRQEKLVYQEIVEQEPRLQEANGIRFGIERMAWIALQTVSLVFVIVIATKNKSLHDKINSRVVQQASALRRLENVT